MKLSEAIKLVNEGDNSEYEYRVHFEERMNGMLASGYFPDFDEPGIKNINEAWEIAKKFAEKAPKRFVNIYVIGGSPNNRFSPVPGYNEKIMRRH